MGMGITSTQTITGRAGFVCTINNRLFCGKPLLNVFRTKERFPNADVVFLLVIDVCCVGKSNKAKGKIWIRGRGGRWWPGRK
jgi:hypothetical protein